MTPSASTFSTAAPVRTSTPSFASLAAAAAASDSANAGRMRGPASTRISLSEAGSNRRNAVGERSARFQRQRSPLASSTPVGPPPTMTSGNGSGRSWRRGPLAGPMNVRASSLPRRHPGDQRERCSATGPYAEVEPEVACAQNPRSARYVGRRQPRVTGAPRPGRQEPLRQRPCSTGETGSPDHGGGGLPGCSTVPDRCVFRWCPRGRGSSVAYLSPGAAGSHVVVASRRRARGVGLLTHGEAAARPPTPRPRWHDSCGRPPWSTEPRYPVVRFLRGRTGRTRPSVYIDPFGRNVHYCAGSRLRVTRRGACRLPCHSSCR